LLEELKQRQVTSLFTIDPAALSVAAGTSLAVGVEGWFDNVFRFAPGTNESEAGTYTIELAKVRRAGLVTRAVGIRLDARQEVS
jgi:circadian clock protein KaiC